MQRPAGHREALADSGLLVSCVALGRNLPAGHTLDAARLYRLALEKAPAGTRLHADGEEGVQFKEIATTIGEMLGVPVKSVPLDQVESYFRFLSAFIALDTRVSNAKTQALLGWTPVGPTLIEDLKEGHYFDN